MTGFIVRVGDQGDYVVKQTIDAVARTLYSHGVTRVDSPRPMGVEADGFRHQNYITLFYGEHNERDGSTPHRDTTLGERETINRLLNPKA